MKKQLNKFIILLLLIIPINILAYSKYVIPGGETIGIEVESNGVLVVGFYKVDNEYPAKKVGFKEKDIIIKVNNTKITSIEEMLNVINHSKQDKIEFTVLRNNKEVTMHMDNTILSSNQLKTGLYVKDKINGVGTLSYIDPKTKIFGSLGHEIIESKTNTKLDIKDGTIYEANVSSITKSRSGVAGEKNASYNKTNIYGIIAENTTVGIYGTYTSPIDEEKQIEIATKNEVTTGKAILRTVIKDNVVQDYEINILRINDKSPTKNILFEITDEELLKETGGIIQGMSGSPIIQNNKLIAAVNYVVVNEPTKGYAIFIETMLKEGED